MSTTDAPRATAQGTLAKTPFAHLVQFIFSRELSGTLAVWPDDDGALAGVGQDRVLFHQGVPTAMRSRRPANEFASALAELFGYSRAPYAFYDGQNLLGGSEGVLREQVDPYAVLSAGVRSHATPEQVASVLAKLGGRQVRLRVGFPVSRLMLDAWEEQLVELIRSQPMTLDEATRLGAEGHDASRRLLYLLVLVKGLESLEASTRGTSVRLESTSSPIPPGASAPLGGRSKRPPSVRVPPTAQVPRITPPGGGPPVGGSPSWRPAYTPTPRSTPSTPSSRPSAPAASRANSRKRLQPASIPPPEDAPIPEKPDSLSPEEAMFWDEVVARVSQLDHFTHFDMLGVTQRALTAEITTAYFTLVKRWHPDRVPQALHPLQSHIKELFERMTEAHDTLTSDEKRIAYIKTVSDGGGTRAAERMMAAVVESAMEMQKAEVLMRRRNYREAFDLVQQAIERNPDEADNYAIRGWLKHLLEPASDTIGDDLLADIDRTLDDNPQNAKAHYYRGVVLKRLGRTQDAIQHFVRASQLDPRHIEAQREVRLAQIRKQSIKPGTKKPSGIWGKLFSKDD